MSVIYFGEAIALIPALLRGMPIGLLFDILCEMVEHRCFYWPILKCNFYSRIKLFAIEIE